MNQLTAVLVNPANLQPLLQKLPNIASTILVIATAYTLAEITWMLLPQDEPEVSTAIKRPVANKNKTGHKQAFQQLTAAHLFGTANQVATAAPAKATETNLNFVLRGVLAVGSKELASAIISRSKNGKEEIYGIDDKLPGGVTIKEIHPEHVLLLRQGRLEILRLTKDKSLGKLSKARSRSRSTSNASTQGATLGDIRKNILKNPASFGDYALPIVVKENGKQIGYRLQPQKKGDMLAEIGIQPNDVITSINGIKLDNPANGIGALRKLSSASEINITVKRNGAEVPLNIRLQ